MDCRRDPVRSVSASKIREVDVSTMEYLEEVHCIFVQCIGDGLRSCHPDFVVLESKCRECLCGR